MLLNAFSQQHEMQLERIHPAGPLEWACSECSRKLLLQIEPQFHITVLETGDERFSHTGSTMDDLRIGPAQIMEIEELTLPEDLRAAIEDVLKNIEFDNE